MRVYLTRSGPPLRCMLDDVLFGTQGAVFLRRMLAFVLWCAPCCVLHDGLWIIAVILSPVYVPPAQMNLVIRVFASRPR
jgi:hypothetical protein